MNKYVFEIYLEDGWPSAIITVDADTEKTAREHVEFLLRGHKICIGADPGNNPFIVTIAEDSPIKASSLL